MLNENKKTYTRDDMGEFLFNDFEATYDNIKVKDLRPFEREMWAAVYNNDLESYIASILAGANYTYRDKNGFNSGVIARKFGYNDIAGYFDDPIDLVGGTSELKTPKYLIDRAQEIKNEIYEWIVTLNLPPQSIDKLF
jgi:hypothetical protein